MVMKAGNKRYACVNIVAWPAQQVNKAHNNNTWDITFYYKCYDATVSVHSTICCS